MQDCTLKYHFKTKFRQNNSTHFNFGFLKKGQVYKYNNTKAQITREGF